MINRIKFWWRVIRRDVPFWYRNKDSRHIGMDKYHAISDTVTCRFGQFGLVNSICDLPRKEFLNLSDYGYFDLRQK